MRPIHLARLEKTRPALVLTRERARSARSRVTIAPITSTIRGLSCEVRLGPSNGLDHDCVVNCDNIQTIPAADLGRNVGFLHDQQEALLVEAIGNAFDLRIEELGSGR